MSMTDTVPAQNPSAPRRGSLLSRLMSRHAAILLVRNTVVSCGVFSIGLALMWLLVERSGVNATIAAGISFVIGSGLHYLVGRSWVFRGTDRAFGSGLALFLINSALGLVLTMGLFNLLVRFTPMNYLVARTLVSVVVGLLVFVLNAVLTFRRL
jgi:putative flippase GtrA